MLLKCRLCKKDFESPSFKPFCEPHAKAYEKFKRTKTLVVNSGVDEAAVADAKRDGGKKKGAADVDVASSTLPPGQQRRCVIDLSELSGLSDAPIDKRGSDEGESGNNSDSTGLFH